MNDFAKTQLLKYGWTEGKGLGKNESGITDAIKPKLKFDLAGVGHKGEDWNEWWATSFNSAANNIIVESQLHGVSISVSKENKNDSLKKHLTNKTFSYGNFLKASTLFNGNLVQEDSSNIVKEKETQYNVNHISLTDDELFKICGGRTAHKGARHGLKLNGKLKRIEEQEKNLLQKHNNKSERDICDSDEDTLPINLSPSEEERFSKSSKRARRNKRRVNDLTYQLNTLCNINDTDNAHKESICNDDSMQKLQLKRKKRKIKKESLLSLKKSIKTKKKEYQKKKKNKHGVLYQTEQKDINILNSTLHREFSSTDIRVNFSQDINSYIHPESSNIRLTSEADKLNYRILKKKKAKFLAKEKMKLQNIVDSLEAVYLNTENSTEKMNNKKRLDTVIETMVGINIAADKTKAMQKRSNKKKNGKKK